MCCVALDEKKNENMMANCYREGLRDGEESREIGSKTEGSKHGRQAENELNE